MEEHKPRNQFDIPAVFYFEVGNTHSGSRDHLRYQVKPEDGYRGVSFYHPVYTGYVMSVYVTPIGEPDSAVRTVGDAILNSLSPWSEPFEE